MAGPRGQRGAARESARGAPTLPRPTPRRPSWGPERTPRLGAPCLPVLARARHRGAPSTAVWRPVLDESAARTVAVTATAALVPRLLIPHAGIEPGSGCSYHATLASGWLASLAGWDSNPLGCIMRFPLPAIPWPPPHPGFVWPTPRRDPLLGRRPGWAVPRSDPSLTLHYRQAPRRHRWQCSGSHQASRGTRSAS